jgi:hypothetical protein
MNGISVDRMWLLFQVSETNKLLILWCLGRVCNEG